MTNTTLAIKPFVVETEFTNFNEDPQKAGENGNGICVYKIEGTSKEINIFNTAFPSNFYIALKKQNLDRGYQSEFRYEVTRLTKKEGAQLTINDLREILYTILRQNVLIRKDLAELALAKAQS